MSTPEQQKKNKSLRYCGRTLNEAGDQTDRERQVSCNTAE